MPDIPSAHEASAPARNKLGLALAGGGFRASLFHLGVLRRMAELDLLRYVEVLSTVSGGSIVGALYVLLLKRDLERASNGRLSRDAYIALVDELSWALVNGIRKNLRTRLFLNPFGILRVLLTEHTLGKRMARLYERYLYAAVVNDLRPRSWWQRWLRPGQIPLRDIRIEPHGGRRGPGGRRAGRSAITRHIVFGTTPNSGARLAFSSTEIGDTRLEPHDGRRNPSLTSGIEAYNREVLEDGEPGSAVTKLIINATALNSGARFWFSSTEIGDWYLGHFRESEIRELLERKKLLERVERPPSVRGGRPAKDERDGTTFLPGTVSLALWWRQRRRQSSTLVPEGWKPLFAVPGFPGKLPESEFGRLRQAKLSAWYLRIGSTSSPPAYSGLTDGQLWEQVWDALKQIDPGLTTTLRAAVDASISLGEMLLDFLLELHWIRSAEIVSPRIQGDWDKLTLGEAVGASACFPPVFAPLVMMGFYDDAHVARLGLTDGGVFDNLGITALVDERCSHVIVSDTSGLFDMKRHAATGRVGMSVRIVEVLTNALGHFQCQGLEERADISRALAGDAQRSTELREFRDHHRLEALTVFQINSPPLTGSEEDAESDRQALAGMRTDLDGFGEIEMAALINHGYDTADAHIRRSFGDTSYARRSADHWKPPTGPLVPMAGSARRARRIVEVGRSRLLRSLKLGAPVSWLFVIAALGVLVSTTWKVHLSVSQLAARTVLGPLSFLARHSGLATAWMRTDFPVGRVLLVAVGAALLVWLLPLALVVSWLKAHRLKDWARRVAFAAKWLWSFRGNALWLFGPLPVVLAFLTSLLAALSYVFFHLPFLARTRNPACSTGCGRTEKPGHG